ncbi:tRNA 2-thiouridine(34) synthase MnmA [bacterium]|nr:tRNA 2-thiouridine(34) synthase MnmA [bacterium]
MTKKVAVALSGGVDSAVAALLLKNSGYEVVGITGKMVCDSNADEVVKNAAEVANKLNIEHFVIDASEEFKKRVIDYFENSYKTGKTPNPCIMCNKFIKWGVLFDYAINVLDCDFVATGHYANIKKNDEYYKLYPASDEHKDQLYFLFTLSQEHLSKTLFPLSKLKKEQVRELAIQNNLPPKSSKESQDICFIKPPNTTKKYLNDIFKSQEGCFVEQTTGKVLGKHSGFWQFTIGQRKGIGIAAPQPLYVVNIDADSNTVFVGNQNELYSSELLLNDFNWAYSMKDSEFDALVKIRYNMPHAKAKINIEKDVVKIMFETPVSGITPGQACVVYDAEDGHLLGGSFIN